MEVVAVGLLSGSEDADSQSPRPTHPSQVLGEGSPGWVFPNKFSTVIQQQILPRRITFYNLYTFQKNTIGEYVKHTGSAYGVCHVGTRIEFFQ